jgi:hypothetical protein
MDNHVTRRKALTMAGVLGAGAALVQLGGSSSKASVSLFFS